MFTEGLDNNALKWVREVSFLNFLDIFCVLILSGFVFFCFIWTFIYVGFPQILEISNFEVEFYDVRVSLSCSGSDF